MPGIFSAFVPRFAVFALVVFAGVARAQVAPAMEAIISVADQRMVVLCGGAWVGKYPVSTSKFGTGDAFGSYKTPLGKMRVCEKIGDGFAAGAVMKGRAATGEVLPVNAPGRDPIVTRILWLEGLEEQNRNAHSRAIYIHGTPEEERIGDAVSWGCIRMRSRDVITLFDELPLGAAVTVIAERLPRFPRFDPRELPMIAERTTPKLSTTPIAATSLEPKAPARSQPASSPAGSSASALLGMKGSILFSGLDAMETDEPASVAAR